MTVETLTLVVELIGSVGIIATLAFLAEQVRQSANQARADNQRAISNRWIEAQNSVFRTEDGAEFIRRALNDFAALKPAEKGRFNAFMLDLLVAFQAVSDLHERRLIAHDLFVATQRVLAGYMRCPGAADYWKTTRDEYPPALVRQVDLAIQTHERPPLTKTMPYLAMGDGH